MRFLLRYTLEDVYWKVAFPTVTDGIELQGGCNSIQFNILKRMHLTLIRIESGLRWDTSTED